LVSQLLHPQPKGADKIYALHDPQVGCISKGKARMRHEFGCKVSLATTLAEGFVVGMRSFAGNPYGGDTLKEALEQVTILTGQRPDLAVVDRGDRRHGVEATRVLISGTRRGPTPRPVADLRRRSAIEAGIDHKKTGDRLSRCPLKGTIGDAIFAALCACGHNIRKILAHLRPWLASLCAAMLNATCHPNRKHHALTAAGTDRSRQTTYRTASARGAPSAVKPLRTATRTWNSGNLTVKVPGDQALAQQLHAVHI
jgi:IS5 family transposase